MDVQIEKAAEILKIEPHLLEKLLSYAGTPLSRCIIIPRNTNCKLDASFGPKAKQFMIYLDSSITEAIKEYYKTLPKEENFKEINVPLLANLEYLINCNVIYFDDIYLMSSISNPLLSDAPSPANINTEVYGGKQPKLCIGNIHTHPTGVHNFSSKDTDTYKKWWKESYFPRIIDEEHNTAWIDQDKIIISTDVGYKVKWSKLFIGMMWEYPFNEIKVMVLTNDKEIKKLWEKGSKLKCIPPLSNNLESRKRMFLNRIRNAFKNGRNHTF